MDLLSTYKQAIAREFGDEVTVHLYWKGRVALYSILKSLGIGPGDEVILPGLTCVVVPNAVIYANAKPVYADVDHETYTITRETIAPLITRRTRAIIAQNSFGLSSDLDPILDLARDTEIEVIDDCTHGFGGTYKGRQNGSVTRASFFSTQWNKPFSTGVGGFAITRDPALGQELRQLENKARPPSFREVTALRTLYLARRHVVGDFSYWPLLKLYRLLSSKNLVVGSSQGEELISPQMPDGFLKALSGFQARIGIDGLKGFADSIRFRNRAAAEYDRVLADLGKTVPLRPDYAEHIFLKYPVRVKHRDRLMQEAEKHRVRLGDWFNSPLHPIAGNLAPWGFLAGSCPRAEEIARQLVNLPTDPDMSLGALDRVKRFVRSYAEHFL